MKPVRNSKTAVCCNKFVGFLFRRSVTYPVTRILPVAWIVAVGFSCAPKHPDFDSASFETWFTAASHEVPLNIRSASSAVIDSIVHTIRASSSAGVSVVTLNDTAQRPYVIGFRTPVNMRRDTLYPCVIYLHGGVGTLRNDKGDSAWRMLDMINDSMELFLVSPSADRVAPWWSAAGLSRILQTLRYMTLHYPVDPDRVFLAGVSDGATGCWAAANVIGGPFAGFVAVSGFGGMLPNLGMQLFAENLMQRPIYNVNAGRDRLYPIDMVEKFLDAMEREGVGVMRRIYPEEEHGFDYRMREAGTLCRILREWSRRGPDAIRGRGMSGYPVDISKCIMLKPVPGAQQFAVNGFCSRDTFFLRTSGIDRFLMYFDQDDPCARPHFFVVNGAGARRYRPVAATREIELLLMKQRCLPGSTGVTYYKIH